MSADAANLCALCETNPGTIYCKNCKAYYCSKEYDDCDNDYHRTGSFKSHVREPVSSTSNPAAATNTPSVASVSTLLTAPAASTALAPSSAASSAPPSAVSTSSSAAAAAAKTAAASHSAAAPPGGSGASHDVCELCEGPATKYCDDCLLPACDTCCAEIHDDSKFKHHKLRSIGPAVAAITTTATPSKPLASLPAPVTATQTVAPTQPASLSTVAVPGKAPLPVVLPPLQPPLPPTVTSSSSSSSSSSSGTSAPITASAAPAAVLEDLCDVCAELPSALQCKECDMSFCAGCNDEMHMTATLRSHKRTPIVPSASAAALATGTAPAAPASTIHSTAASLPSNALPNTQGIAPAVTHTVTPVTPTEASASTSRPLPMPLSTSASVAQPPSLVAATSTIAGTMPPSPAGAAGLPSSSASPSTSTSTIASVQASKSATTLSASSAKPSLPLPRSSESATRSISSSNVKKSTHPASKPTPSYLPSPAPSLASRLRASTARSSATATARPRPSLTTTSTAAAAAGINKKDTSTGISGSSSGGGGGDLQYPDSQPHDVKQEDPEGKEDDVDVEGALEEACSTLEKELAEAYYDRDVVVRALKLFRVGIDVDRGEVRLASLMPRCDEELTVMTGALRKLRRVRTTPERLVEIVDAVALRLRKLSLWLAQVRRVLVTRHRLRVQRIRERRAQQEAEAAALDAAATNMLKSAWQRAKSVYPTSTSTETFADDVPVPAFANRSELNAEREAGQQQQQQRSELYPPRSMGYYPNTYASSAFGPWPSRPQAHGSQKALFDSTLPSAFSSSLSRTIPSRPASAGHRPPSRYQDHHNHYPNPHGRDGTSTPLSRLSTSDAVVDVDALVSRFEAEAHEDLRRRNQRAALQRSYDADVAYAVEEEEGEGEEGGHHRHDHHHHLNRFRQNQSRSGARGMLRTQALQRESSLSASMSSPALAGCVHGRRVSECADCWSNGNHRNNINYNNNAAFSSAFASSVIDGARHDGVFNAPAISTAPSYQRTRTPRSSIGTDGLSGRGGRGASPLASPSPSYSRASSTFASSPARSGRGNNEVHSQPLSFSNGYPLPILTRGDSSGHRRTQSASMSRPPSSSSSSSSPWSGRKPVHHLPLASETWFAGHGKRGDSSGYVYGGSATVEDEEGEDDGEEVDDPASRRFSAPSDAIDRPRTPRTAGGINVPKLDFGGIRHQVSPEKRASVPLARKSRGEGGDVLSPMPRRASARTASSMSPATHSPNPRNGMVPDSARSREIEDSFAMSAATHPSRRDPSTPRLTPRLEKKSQHYEITGGDDEDLFNMELGEDKSRDWVYEDPITSGDPLDLPIAFRS